MSAPQLAEPTCTEYDRTRPQVAGSPFKSTESPTNYETAVSTRNNPWEPGAVARLPVDGATCSRRRPSRARRRRLSARLLRWQTVQRAVFRSGYGFMAAALALTGTAMVMVVGLFKVYHALGRLVSLSPVNITTAFDAPLLKDADNNAEIEKLMVRDTTHRS